MIDMKIDQYHIMTGDEIIKTALEEWAQKDGFNDERDSWGDYWEGVLDDIEPNHSYKTDSEFSYFEEMSEDD